MSVLLLRMAGPMQSWGTQSRFSVRDTGIEPSKSGVIGLLCAALGRPRQHPVDDLVKLRMGVRVDREGRMARDYHTAGGCHRQGETYGVIKADGSRGDPVTSSRYYLADADFLVGLEGDLKLLQQLDQALSCPVWQLFLGRKAFVPGLPVRVPDGLRPDQPLLTVLQTHPWEPRNRWERPPQRLRMVLEAAPGDGEPRMDVPLSFADRTFTVRYVRTDFCPTPLVSPTREDEPCS